MKPIKITLNGKERSLYFDWNVVADFEDEQGTSFFFASKSENMGFNTIRGLYWAGLRHEKKNLKVADVGNILMESIKTKEHSFKELGSIVIEAINESDVLSFMGFGREGEEKPKN